MKAPLILGNNLPEVDPTTLTGTCLRGSARTLKLMHTLTNTNARADGCEHCRKHVVTRASDCGVYPARTHEHNMLLSGFFL